MKCPLLCLCVHMRELITTLLRIILLPEVSPAEILLPESFYKVTCPFGAAFKQSLFQPSSHRIQLSLHRHYT